MNFIETGLGNIDLYVLKILIYYNILETFIF